jgi:hypothetical protein
MRAVKASEADFAKLVAALYRTASLIATGADAGAVDRAAAQIGQRPFRRVGKAYGSFNHKHPPAWMAWALQLALAPLVTPLVTPLVVQALAPVVPWNLTGQPQQRIVNEHIVNEQWTLNVNITPGGTRLRERPLGEDDGFPSPTVLCGLVETLSPQRLRTLPRATAAAQARLVNQATCQVLGLPPLDRIESSGAAVRFTRAGAPGDRPVILSNGSGGEMLWLPGQAYGSVKLPLTTGQWTGQTVPLARIVSTPSDYLG